MRRLTFLIAAVLVAACYRAPGASTEPSSSPSEPGYSTAATPSASRPASTPSAASASPASDASTPPAGLILAFQHHGENPATAAILDAIAGGPIDLGRAEEVSWSRDGREVHLVREGPDCVPTLLTLATDGTLVASVTGGLRSEDFSFAWSPDGRTIAFLRYQKGPPENMCGSQGGTAPPEDTVKDLVVMNADGSSQRVLVKGGWPWPIAWSPDGARLAFIEWLQPTESQRLSVVDLATGTISHLAEAEGLSELSWSPDGQRIRVRSFDEAAGPRIVAVDFETGSVVELVILFEGAHEVALSSDGRRAAAAVDVVVDGAILWGNIDVWNVGTAARATIKLGDVQSFDPLIWSPDGDWIAFTKVEGSNGGWGGIDLVRSDGSGRREVPGSAGYTLVSWQPTEAAATEAP